jgi:hypothetical protein
VDVDVLVWLAVPLGVTALGACLIVWRCRPRQPQGPVKTAAAYADFQAALQRPSWQRTQVAAQPDSTRRAVALRPARSEQDAASSYRPAGVTGRSG